MKTSIPTLLTLLSLSAICSLPFAAQGAGEQFHGAWNLTLPTGSAGWLGVEEKDGELTAQLLWGGGSVLPIKDVSLEGDALVLKRVRKPRVKKGQAPPKPIIETITAKRDGKTLRMMFETRREGGKPNRSAFTGVWCPPPPAKPDLAKAKYGEPVALFDGSSLDGWTLTNPDQPNGWSIQGKELVNDPKQPDDGRHLRYGNLRTKDTFEDFNVKLEFNVPEKGNSGVYLRGIYEIQVSDAFGKDTDSHNLGGLYSRITPTENAAKPAGEWQTLDITLLHRHVTVILNGKTVIDNQPVLGCTGGALWSDTSKPGPIFLQGDHTGVRYRNIILPPIK